MMKPHWRCPRCDHDKYNVLSNRDKNISCKRCGLRTGEIPNHRSVKNG